MKNLMNVVCAFALTFAACVLDDQLEQPQSYTLAADDPSQAPTAEPQFLALAEPIKNNQSEFKIFLFSSLDLKNVGFVASTNSWIAGNKVKGAKESIERKLYTYQLTFSARLEDGAPVTFRGQAGDTIYVVTFTAEPNDKGFDLKQTNAVEVSTTEYSQNGSSLPDSAVPETFVSLGSQISGGGGADTSGSSQRALDCLHRAQRSIGGRIGGGGCNAVTNGLNGGRHVGAMRSVQCLPGDVLRWGGGANLRRTRGGNIFTGSGHYAVVESDNGSTVTFLHQNNGGSGVQRETVYKHNYSGSVAIYRP
jgi:hypothetical protein